MQEETIVQIYEEDHGCEGIQPGEIPMDEVLLRDDAGAERWVKLPDAILLAHCLRGATALFWKSCCRKRRNASRI